MPEFDPEKFLNTPIYAFDFQFMIVDVKDLLEFSASNIDSQRQCELQATHIEKIGINFRLTIVHIWRRMLIIVFVKGFIQL